MTEAERKAWNAAIEAAAQSAVAYGQEQAKWNKEHVEYAFHVVDDCEAVADTIRSLAKPEAE